jgi:hypothetical protein
MAIQREPFRRWEWLKDRRRVVASLTIGSAIVLAFLALSIAVTPSGEPHAALLNVSVVLLAIAVGWLLGVLISPYNKDEQQRFSEYARAFGVFISGYLIAKVDKILEKVLDPVALFEPTRQFRFLSFLTVCIVATLVTFIGRSYEIDGLDEGEDPEDGAGKPPAPAKANDRTTSSAVRRSGPLGLRGSERAAPVTVATA